MIFGNKLKPFHSSFHFWRPQMKYLCALVAIVIVTGTAQGDELVTYSWSGTIEKHTSTDDPWDVGESGKPFTISVTLLSSASDTHPTFAVAPYVAKSAELTVDGVPALLRSDIFGSPASLTFEDNISLPNQPIVDFVYINAEFELNEVALGISSVVRLDPSTFALSNDAPLPIFPNGTIAFTRVQNQSATNGYRWVVLAGTPYTVTVTSLSVLEHIENLVLLIDDVNIANGIANALDAKLENILDAWVAENADVREDVINKLGAFINAVEAQRGNKITNADADDLVDAALHIIDLILTGAP